LGAFRNDIYVLHTNEERGMRNITMKNLGIVLRYQLGSGAVDKLYELKLLNKIFDVLESFTPEKPEYSLTELQKKLNLHKATLYRILLNLETREYIQKSRYSGKYRLGSKFAVLANVCLSGLDLREVSHSFTRTLAEETGETIIINVMEGYHGVCIERINSTQPVKITAEIGHQVPLLRGASGKILAAYCDDRQIAAIYEKEKGELAKPLEEIRRDLSDLREKGHAITFEELDRDTAGISFPIRNAAGVVVAGLSVIGPLFRFNDSKVPGLLRFTGECAALISKELGYGGNRGESPRAA